MAAETCRICAESYTGTIRRKIDCPFCHEGICYKCVEQFILSITSDPYCMYCKKVWPRSLLKDFCTPTFLNSKYAKHRQNILVQREKSYIPELQVFVEREKVARDLQKTANTILGEIRDLENEYRKKHKILFSKHEEIERNIRTLRNRRNISSEEELSKEKRKFVRRCTVDGCKGYVSSSWKCGLCSNWICPDCFECKGQTQDSPHTCDPATIETANLIKKSAKPCPSCGEMISKIDGCDAMWCTACHTPFSWKDEKIIVSGNFHNPHHLDWIRKNGGEVPRTHGDVVCGGLPHFYTFNSRFLSKFPGQAGQYIATAYRTTAHIQDVEMRRFRKHLEPVRSDLIVWNGMHYLMNRITEDEWKTVLAKDEKDRQKSREISDVLQTLVDVSTGIIIKANNYDNKTNVLTFKEAIETELENLRQFINNALLNIARSYKCSTPIIMIGWILTSGNHTIPRNIQPTSASATSTPI